MKKERKERFKVEISYAGYQSTDHYPEDSEDDFIDFVDALEMDIDFISRTDSYDHVFEVKGNKNKLIKAWTEKPDGRYVDNPLGEGDYLSEYCLCIDGTYYDQSQDPVFFRSNRSK